MTTPGETTPNFEAAYQELSEIIDQLEAGEASLDDTLKLYERGRTLIGLCQDLLDAAELRITRLSDDTTGDS